MEHSTAIVEAAKILNVTPRRARGRLIKLGYTEPCSRCCGSGHYSFNRIDGTRCFGCGGSGLKLQRITKTKAREAASRIEAGELDQWFAECQAKGEARRAIAPRKSKLDEAWKAGSVHTAYKKTDKQDASITVRSPVFRAAGLINSLWDESNRIERAVKTGKLGACEALAAMEQVSSWIDTVNTSWTRFVE